jgi:hypothetical protein
MKLIFDPGADVHVIDQNTLEITAPKRMYIAVINQSTVLKDSDITAALPAFQRAVNEDFEPLWNIGANMEFKGNVIPTGAAVIAVLDDSPQADALGLHDLTADGFPIGKVYAKTDLDAGASWTVTFTHELFELLADPEIVRSGQDANDGTFYAWEVGDAVEADNLGYTIGGTRTLISDFILPSWFERGTTATRFDFMRHLTSPYSLAPGGYIGVWDPVNNTWTIKTADGKPQSPPKGSRRERRIRGRNNWKRSEH